MTDLYKIIFLYIFSMFISIYDHVLFDGKKPFFCVNCKRNPKMEALPITFNMSADVPTTLQYW